MKMHSQQKAWRLLALSVTLATAHLAMAWDLPVSSSKTVPLRTARPMHARVLGAAIDRCINLGNPKAGRTSVLERLFARRFGTALDPQNHDTFETSGLTHPPVEELWTVYSVTLNESVGFNLFRAFDKSLENHHNRDVSLYLPWAMRNNGMDTPEQADESVTEAYAYFYDHEPETSPLLVYSDRNWDGYVHDLRAPVTTALRAIKGEFFPYVIWGDKRELVNSHGGLTGILLDKLSVVVPPSYFEPKNTMTFESSEDDRTVEVPISVRGYVSCIQSELRERGF